MNELRYYHHLKNFEKKLEQKAKDLADQEHNQDIDFKLKQIEFTKKATEQLLLIRDKKEELIKIAHQTKIDNINTINAAKEERLKTHIDSIQNEKRMMEQYHQHEKVITNMLHENDKYLREIGFKEEMQELIHENHKKDLDIQYKDYLRDDLGERINLLKEQNVLEGKRGQIKDDLMNRLEKINDWREEQLQREDDVNRAWLDVRDTEVRIDGKLNDIKNESDMLSLREYEVKHNKQRLKNQFDDIDDYWKMKELEYTNQTLRDDEHVNRNIRRLEKLEQKLKELPPPAFDSGDPNRPEYYLRDE